MKYYPLLFGYKDIVVGNGFLAGISANGRSLLAVEEDRAWVYGVNPGGVCASGADQHTAVEAFREAYRSVLFDIVEDLRDFESFEAGVRAFFEETNEPTEQMWRAAREDVRAGKVDSEWLKKETSETPPQVSVKELSITAQANTLDDHQAAVAA